MNTITISTEKESFVEIAKEAPAGVRIPVEVRLPVSDPFDAYRTVRDTKHDGFYLETTGGQSGWGYFGVDPVERIQVSANVVNRDAMSPSIQAIDALLERERLVRGSCTVPYPCGAFGWLSYDVARELEELPSTTRDERGLPRLQLGIFDRVAAWQEPRDGGVELRITACPIVDDEPTTAYETGREQALSLAQAVIDGSEPTHTAPASAARATFESDCGRAAFADRVQRVKQYIRDGETFQANISHRLVAPAAAHPVDVFDAARRVNPAPYSGLLEFPGLDLISASPELLLEGAGSELVTEPIAGTRPRGETPTADTELERDLRSDEKERAEHAMLVDLERNDLGKVSEFGSVDVTEYRRVDRYSEVMHLVSLVEGSLRDDVNLADAVAAVFPGGTITGAPKPRTMEIIDELEATRRGPYTGSIGIFGFDDRVTLNISIRTLVRHADEYHLRVGAGVVHDSIPEREYDETLDKARALVTAVDEALGEQASFAVETVPDVAGGVE
ncbi:aminodeoxychorismate synthase, component I [Natronorubrum thiooxidans]|uniref:anthranilate synthase n=1 Tax=Natronorubrum thiooxidans TaxID=308853 RepID=A0A1N7GLK8_9EURY|nr:aminodeoxychorismate synthase, component I [Natronorubrum thiooxidans]SIS13412.1 aminodeoxychorismate synthase, subunit I [Natronorubrum thiooxidans]